MAPQKVKLGGSIAAELLLVIAVYIPTLVLQFLEPFQSGLFRNDTSIAYPYHANTISMTGAAFFALASPLLAIILYEISFAYVSKFSRDEYSGLPLVVINLYSLFGLVALSFGAMLLIVQVAKETIGSLRPFFLTACGPDFSSTPVNETYITNIICTGVDKKLIAEARMSFPSGHSACGAFGAWFTGLYLQKVRIPSVAKSFRAFVQVALAAVGVYICLTRIADNWHRPADVIVGYLVGALVPIAAFHTPIAKKLDY